MEMNKLKVKIGEHEFEAEGPTEVVQAQFAAFRDLVANLPSRRAPDSSPAPAVNNSNQRTELMLDKIMKSNDRIVSLTVRGASLDEEILLLLLGQKNLRANESVTGAEILDGLRKTGQTVDRVTYQLNKLTTAGDVITVGVHRARRYRLTNQGFAKAQELAITLVSTVL
jgi:hypothetical protein